MLNILHVYKDYAPVLGGIENHIKLLAERQVVAGHCVTVLVTSPTARRTEEHHNGVRVLKTARWATVASTPVSPGLLREMVRQRPDMVHLHFPYPPGEMAYRCLGRSTPAVVTYHSDVVRQKTLLRFYRPLMMSALRSVDRIIATTPIYVDTSPVLRALRDKVTIVPFGIDQGRFRSVDPEAAERLRQSILGDRLDMPIVLFVGVLRYYKGLAYLIEAMAGIAAHLVIVGAGPEESSLRAQVESLDLADRVTFAGRVSDEDLPLYYAAADIFCLPASARSEAFGLVQVEAMAAGLPVVSTDVGTGVGWVNKDGESGLVVAPRDANALRAAISDLLGDRPRLTRLGEGARARADLFQADRMVQDIDAVYGEVLANRG